MSEAGDAPELVQPVANPDAQTTVNDFLDYTEFFPSDLVRSLTLIGDLDASYHDAVQQVHELTRLYGKLPTLSEPDRPDPILLRKQIAHHLQTAVNQREYAFAEASRLYEVTVRHCQRSSIIKRKLKAQPEPPSRDPTPPPISPSAQRPVYRNYERPAHLRLTFDNAHRPRDRHRNSGARSRHRSRAHSMSSNSSGLDSDMRSAIDVATSPRKHKHRRDRPPKSGRSRPPGVLGTNVHSSVAGISTSNALAQLAPPPPDAKPGSKWAPWMKLTEYEMAVLRKQMKKNAVWTPSLTMVNRELERKHRTRGDYERELARCEAESEELLDEEPETLQQIMTASGLGQLAPHGPAADPAHVPAPTTPIFDIVDEDAKDDYGTVSIRLKHVTSNDGNRLNRQSQRQQATRDAQELVDATEKIKEAAESLKELAFFPNTVPTSSNQKRKTPVRPFHKRKRESSPSHTAEAGADSQRETSIATQSSVTIPEAKRTRLNLAAAASNTTSSPLTTPSTVLSSQDGFLTPLASPTVTLSAPVSVPEAPRTSSIAEAVQVSLALPGSSTPRVIKKSHSSQSSRHPSPSLIPQTLMSVSATLPIPLPTLTLSQAIITAASSRPRRESVVPKITSPTATSVKVSKTATPVPESNSTGQSLVTRPRSARGHVSSLRAQSEEPKPKANDQARVTRETRRHSVFGQAAALLPSRVSSRKKAPPRGEITATEDGQKPIMNVQRTQGSKNKKKIKAEIKAEDDAETVDEDDDQEKYCICNNVSWGQMISCDNHCETEWFHMPCVNITKKDLPTRRTKWYCPACCEFLRVDHFGNPLVPPPLPGRRGNR